MPQKRITTALFLWTACFLMLVHSMIPHDHHSTDDFGLKDISCSYPDNSDHQHKHHDNLPGHCHALNDLTYEKAVVFEFSVNDAGFEYLVSDNASTLQFELYIHSVNHFNPPDRLPDAYHNALLPLRAPPVLS